MNRRVFTIVLFVTIVPLGTGCWMKILFLVKVHRVEFVTVGLAHDGFTRSLWLSSWDAYLPWYRERCAVRSILTPTLSRTPLRMGSVLKI